MPRSRDFDRSTSAKRTFSRICRSCGGTSIFSRLTTLSERRGDRDGALRFEQILDPARQIDRAVVYRQLHAAAKLAVELVFRGLDAGGADLTSRSYSLREPSLSQITRLVSPGALPLIIRLRALTGTASAVSGAATETRSILTGMSSSVPARPRPPYWLLRGAHTGATQTAAAEFDGTDLHGFTSRRLARRQEFRSMRFDPCKTSMVRSVFLYRQGWRAAGIPARACDPRRARGLQAASRTSIVCRGLRSG